MADGKEACHLRAWFKLRRFYHGPAPQLRRHAARESIMYMGMNQYKESIEIATADRRTDNLDMNVGAKQNRHPMMPVNA
jgi:hypothetical protein